MKCKVVPTSARGVSGKFIPPVAPRQKVRGYRPEVPLWSRKHEQDMHIQCEDCLLPQLGDSAHDVVNGMTCAENRPPDRGVLRIFRDIRWNVDGDLGEKS